MGNSVPREQSQVREQQCVPRTLLICGDPVLQYLHYDNKNAQHGDGRCATSGHFVSKQPAVAAEHLIN